jgi:Protein of unknown function (DUF3726)
VICSLNEIETMVRKAAVGAGWSFGLAEEIGRAAAWLAARRINGVGAALAAAEAAPVPAMPEREPEGWIFPDARAAAAPSAFDLLAEAEGPMRVALRRVDQPLLVVGLAGIAAETYGGRYELSFPGGGQADVSAEGVSWNGPMPRPGAGIVIIRQPTHSALRCAMPSAGVTVDDALWDRAREMAARTFVPASDASRARGAGAGLIDND